MSTTHPVALNTTIDSALIQALARQAADRCAGTRGDFDAIAAVILAYSALESFLNEVAQLPQTLLRDHALRQGRGERGDLAHADMLERLAFAMRVALDRHAPVNYRYDLAWEVLAKAPIDSGEGSRQALTMLARLRNDLVHARSAETEIHLHVDPEVAARFDGTWLGEVVERHTHPKYFQFFRDKQLLAEGGDQNRWIHLICTERLAHWACDTAVTLARALVRLAPEPSEFRSRLEGYSLAGAPVRAESLTVAAQHGIAADECRRSAQAPPSGTRG